MRKTLGIVFSSLALAGMSLGFWTLYKTEIRLMNSVPVTTIILDKGIEQYQNINGQFFARARYRYNVNGDVYIGDKVFVNDFNTPFSDYLLALIDPLPLNTPTVAFYNKYDPRDSFLRKSIPYPPYVTILASLLVFTSGLYLIMTDGAFGKSPKRLANGWYDMVFQNTDLISIEKASFVQAIVFSVISVFTFANYFIHASKNHGLLEFCAVCVFILLGSHFWKQAYDARKRAASIDDVHLELESDKLEVEREHKAKVRIKVRRETQVVACNIGIQSYKSSIYGPVESEIWYQNSVDKKVNAKGEFKLEQSLKVPSNLKGDTFCITVRIQSTTGSQEWNFPVLVNGLSEPKAEL